MKAVCLILLALALPATTAAQDREAKIQERNELVKNILYIEQGYLLFVKNRGKPTPMSSERLSRNLQLARMEDEEYDRWMKERVTEPTEKELKEFKSQLDQIMGELALDPTPDDLDFDLELEPGGTESDEVDLTDGDPVGDLDDDMAEIDDTIEDDVVALRGSRFLIAGEYELEITEPGGTYVYRLLVDVDDCPSDPCPIDGSFKQRLRERWYFRGEVSGMQVRFRTLERGLDQRSWSFRGLIDGTPSMHGSLEHVDVDGQLRRGTWTATVKSD